VAEVFIIASTTTAIMAPVSIVIRLVVAIEQAFTVYLHLITVAMPSSTVL
jgi:hypothetical protein